MALRERSPLVCQIRNPPTGLNISSIVMTVQLMLQIPWGQPKSWPSHAHTHTHVEAWVEIFRMGVVDSISIIRGVLVGARGPTLPFASSIYCLPPIWPQYFVPIPLPSIHYPFNVLIGFRNTYTNKQLCIKIRWVFCGCWQTRRNRLRKNIDAVAALAPRAAQNPKPNTFGPHVLLHFLLGVLCGHLWTAWVVYAWQQPRHNGSYFLFVA